MAKGRSRRPYKLCNITHPHPEQYKIVKKKKEKLIRVSGWNMRFLLLVCYVILGSGAYKNNYGKKSDMWKHWFTKMKFG